MRGFDCSILLLFLLVNISLSTIVTVGPNMLSFDEFTEFMMRIDVTDIQWVVEWWRISSMVHSNYNCVLLVGFHCCSYYFTCCIARQFGDRQGAPSDDGSFHTLAFTDRILGRM